MISLRKNGGMWFWRIGRVGGSFYVSGAGAAERGLARRARHRRLQRELRACARLYYHYRALALELSGARP